ncbi:MAG: AAA family ATPase [Treponema sp.]|jgi:flagellar biosynthesis protein FlhG|nr:AAA family ATPase [Treponema sp.]
MRIIPIASGKGGVGKSLVSANLGVAFAQVGQRVVLADLDLGASNLHLVLGHHAPQMGIGTYLNKTKSNFSDVIAETNIRGLRFIPGDNEIPGTANLSITQRKSLVKQLLDLKDNTDILILDLGAGTHQSILDFFLLSNQGIVVSAPSVTAVLNAYVFLKNTVFRLMFNSFAKGSPARNYLEKIRKDGSGGHHKLYIPKMLPEIKKLDPASHEKFIKRLETLNPRLIMNMVDEPKNADVAMKIRRSCEEYLDLKIEHMGIIYRDIIQDTALASRLPVTLYKPQSLLSQAIYRIADKILQSPADDYSPDDKQIEDSFQEAEMEAEIDFDSKMEYVEELLHSGAMKKGDLLETIKSQQLEISKLRKEINLIRLKLSRAIQQGYKV